MSNHIRFNGTADSDDWLVISNQGTDCFLELLISAADTIDKTEHQKELIDFLKAQKMVNNIAPGTADFDIIDMPWKGECFFDDVQFMLQVIESAKTKEAFARLPYTTDREIVLPWLEKFAAITSRLLTARDHQERIVRDGVEYVRSLIPKTKIKKQPFFGMNVVSGQDCLYCIYPPYWSELKKLFREFNPKKIPDEEEV